MDLLVFQFHIYSKISHKSSSSNDRSSNIHEIPPFQFTKSMT